MMKCIDVHCYYGTWPFPILDMSVSDILDMMKTLDMEKCIMMSAQSILIHFSISRVFIISRIWRSVS